MFKLNRQKIEIVRPEKFEEEELEVTQPIIYSHVKKNNIPKKKPENWMDAERYRRPIFNVEVYFGSICGLKLTAIFETGPTKNKRVNAKFWKMSFKHDI